MMSNTFKTLAKGLVTLVLLVNAGAVRSQAPSSENTSSQNVYGWDKSELFAEAESKFFFKVRPFQLIFTKDNKQVTHLEFLSTGETVRMKKIK
jgi:hypothetical protein